MTQEETNVEQKKTVVPALILKRSKKPKGAITNYESAGASNLGGGERTGQEQLSREYGGRRGGK